MLQKYGAIISVEADAVLREWMRLKQAGKRLAASSVYDLINIVNTCDANAFLNIHKLLLLVVSYAAIKQCCL